ncbi:MAG: hypothetical protein ABFS23_04780 [Pseudomonadota bacterium]
MAEQTAARYDELRSRCDRYFLWAVLEGLRGEPVDVSEVGS